MLHKIKFMIRKQPSQPSPLMCALLSCSPPASSSSDAMEYGYVERCSRALLYNCTFSPHRPEDFEKFLKIYGPDGDKKGEMGLGAPKLQHAARNDQ